MVKEFPAAWNDSPVSGHTVLYNKTLLFGSSSFGMNVVAFFLFYVTAGPDLQISARRGNKKRLKRRKRRRKIENLQELHEQTPFAG